MTHTAATPTLTKEDLLHDYRLGWESRHASLIGRREVFSGKAKFGIFGDGKEVAQLAMARAFRPGDFRSGYYRDQTFMMAIGELTTQQFFAQLYADTEEGADPASGGRMMNGHFATRTLDEAGRFRTLTDLVNSSADGSPTAAQMPRLVGLAWASKLYRQNADLHSAEQFSRRGEEIAFGTIGNASTSEGLFFEAINAAGVLQIPMLTSVWDDGYGISVPKEYHTTKGSISEALKGFQRTADAPGLEILAVPGWDYPALCEAYARAAELCRTEHLPVLLHVTEMTQPQGHSTSGSHERYKSKERLAWEAEHDCLAKMRAWLLSEGVADADELDALEADAKQAATVARRAAWKAFEAGIEPDQRAALDLLERAATASTHADALRGLRDQLSQTLNPIRADAIRTVKQALRVLREEPDNAIRPELLGWLRRVEAENDHRFRSHLYSESDEAAIRVPEVPPVYADDSPTVDGREVLQANFDAVLARDPRVVIFGEDVGKIGGVNQAMAGLQDKYGALRVTDTGIREATIVGQGIGAALRGLRPIAEIQYLDYLLYAVQTLSDDLACLHYRTRGGQKAPLIVRTRGHRLEGIWHSGSPMGMILHSLRGMHVLSPRNMTQAAGMYNTLLRGDEPALLIESLNGYRLKEKMPQNIGEFTVPLGVPEVLREGDDLTLVTYGSMCRVALDAAEQLATVGLSCEVIDVQTLLPFDVSQRVLTSIKKTNRVIFADEDVPGGASAFMLQQVVEGQGAYHYLDSPPRTVSAQAHRPAYASDGDYFSKPNAETLFDAAYALLHEAEPRRFPALYE